MKKVYIILNDYTEDLDHEDFLSGTDLIAICATLDAAIEYLRNYEDILKKRIIYDKSLDRYKDCKFEENDIKIDSKFTYLSYELGPVSNCLYIDEVDLIGG